MSVAVVTKDEADVLAARIAALEATVAELKAAAPTARAYLTPKEVAARHGVRFSVVYAACDDGRLPAEKTSRAGRVAYRIQPADAAAWYVAYRKAQA